ncbi:PREDICTED: cyclin-H [Hipposideros armiger]|uniref:Cyclin-H n=1 Tax=Hipposideros armiger TaxID=186990 RepID=A0A8B7R6L9_HIPAR|nr:PREDICTED: cyclin-H [Hipposideros armiger]
MYHNSSQKRHWTFASEEQLARLRADANRKFKCKAVANGKVLPNDPVFLEPHEEMTLCKYYEKRLLEFCSVFKPAMPRSVVGTACMYFKRFYLNNSVMEYHPRIIMLTCAFLACKVDEFNVSSPQFVGNLRESPLGQEKALEQILEYELLLIQQLNFHLIVHNPYRPFEGFLIDIKVTLLICMRNLVKKYEPPRSEEVAVLKQKLERCHSAELALNVITKKRKGYEDDDYVSKKSKHEEEEWTDDDLVDSV